MTVKDSKLFGWNIQLAYGRGEINVIRTTFKQSDAGYMDTANSLLRWRADTGLGYEGNVNVTDCTLVINQKFKDYKLAVVQMFGFENTTANPTVDWYMPNLTVRNLSLRIAAKDRVLTEKVKVCGYLIHDKYAVPNKIHLPDRVSIDGMSTDYQSDKVNLCGFYGLSPRLDDSVFADKKCNVLLENIHNDISALDPLNLDVSTVGEVMYLRSLFDLGGVTV
ncbi:hypothetical protein, partial [Photobacterium sanguinicancri]|uniref:hypothetical protein n=1 Tax=Photobacterium sanguinicancri TaxID=875932 RepID=UPI002480A026